MDGLSFAWVCTRARLKTLLASELSWPELSLLGWGQSVMLAGFACLLG